MKCYFHCNANMYRKKVRTFLEYTAAPVVSVVTFLMVCLLLSLRNLMHSRLLTPALVIVCSVIFAFALVTRIMLEIAEHRVRVHSKYTYVEIGLKDVIVSLYAGSFTHWGRKTVLRRLVVIPLEEFESVRVSKNEQVLVKAKSAAIRDYIANTDRLGYFFKDGDFEFREYFFRERGFNAVQQVYIPRLFTDADEIAESILAAKERFDNLPSPKPYSFEEMPFVKTRKMRSLNKRLRGF